LTENNVLSRKFNKQGHPNHSKEIQQSEFVHFLTNVCFPTLNTMSIDLRSVNYLFLQVSGHLPEKWRHFVFPKRWCVKGLGLELVKIHLNTFLVKRPFGQVSIRASVLDPFLHASNWVRHLHICMRISGLFFEEKRSATQFLHCTVAAPPYLLEKCANFVTKNSQRVNCAFFNVCLYSISVHNISFKQKAVSGKLFDLILFKSHQWWSGHAGVGMTDKLPGHPMSVAQHYFSHTVHILLR